MYFPPSKVNIRTYKLLFFVTRSSLRAREKSFCCDAESQSVSQAYVSEVSVAHLKVGTRIGFPFEVVVRNFKRDFRIHILLSNLQISPYD